MFCHVRLRISTEICYTHTHPFNGPLSGTTQVNRYQKGKTSLDFTEARDSEWQWHQLGHIQCAPCSRQITMPAPHHSVFLQAGCPSCCLTNSIKALKAQQRSVSRLKKERGLNLRCRLQGITIIRVSWLAALKIRKTATVPHTICSDNYYYCYVR